MPNPPPQALPVSLSHFCRPCMCRTRF